MLCDHCAGQRGISDAVEESESLFEWKHVRLLETKRKKREASIRLAAFERRAVVVCDGRLLLRLLHKIRGNGTPVVLSDN